MDFPGCFAYGKDASTALLSIPPALLQYERWIAQHTLKALLVLGDFDIRLVDVWEDFNIDENFDESEDVYEVNAWFLDDWHTLNEEDVEHGLALLEWGRADLLSLLTGLDDSVLDAPRPLARTRPHQSHFKAARFGCKKLPSLTTSPESRL